MGHEGADASCAARAPGVLWITSKKTFNPEKGSVMPNNAVPPPDASKEVLDKFFDIYESHLKNAIDGLGAVGKEFESELKEAQQRQEQIKAVNKKKWFMKLRGSLSEALKSKCIPHNALTITMLKKDINQAGRWYGKLKPMTKTAGYYKDLQKKSGYEKESYNLLRTFILNYIEEGFSVEHWLQTVRKDLKVFLDKEKQAFDALMNYVSAKKDLAGTEDLKQFKADWQKLIKTIE